MTSRPSVCVAMIVKNESHCIARSLGSIRGFADAWAIVDTGSTDDTAAVIEKATEGWTGKLGRYTGPWPAFGAARTESLRLAKETGCDYAFILDADELFVPPAGFEWPTDEQDIYTILATLNGVAWPQARLLKLSTGWRYDGVLHEVPAADGPVTKGHVEGLSLTSPRDGARSKNPNKYRDDALALEAELARDPSNSRYVFYCAQSWRDAKEYEKAIAWYERRIPMGRGTNPGELALSLFEIARAMHRLERPEKDVRTAYLRAYAADPRRAEPLCLLAAFCREQKDFALAWHFATLAAQKEQPVGLFVDTKVYRWLARDEFAIAAANLGQFALSVRVLDEILESPDIPEAEQVRIRANREVFAGLLKGKQATSAAA